MNDHIVSEPLLSAGIATPPTRIVVHRGGLFLLIIAASLALGWQGSWWLVPGYWLVMSWLLLGGESRTVLSTPVDNGSLETETPGCDGAPTASPGEPLPDVDTAASRKAGPNRARRRARKPRAGEPVATATWVQVAPGKFVRVEVSSSVPEASLAASGEPVLGQEAPVTQAEVVIETPEQGRPGPFPVSTPELASETEAVLQASIDARQPDAPRADGRGWSVSPRPSIRTRRTVAWRRERLRRLDRSHVRNQLRARRRTRRGNRESLPWVRDNRRGGSVG